MTKFDIIERVISATEGMDDIVQLRVIKATMQFLQGGEIPELQGVEAVVFNTLRFDMDLILLKERSAKARRASAGRKSGESRRAKKTKDEPANMCSLFAEQEESSPKPPQEEINNNKNNIINNNQDKKDIKTSSSFSSSPTPSSFSPSSSERLVKDVTEGKDLSSEDKAYFEFFFWSNFKEPREEVSRFKSWNGRRKWKTSVGEMDTLEGRMMAASEWKPKVAGQHCNPKFLSLWRACYDIVKCRSPEVAEQMIYRMKATEWNGMLTVYMTRPVFEIISKMKETQELWGKSDLKKQIKDIDKHYPNEK